MNDKQIVSQINEFLHEATIMLSAWLGEMLPRVDKDDWWRVCVHNNLSYSQLHMIESKNSCRLGDLDLAALLRVADKNWYAMRNFAYLPTSERECIRDMMRVRNNWAHCQVDLPGKDMIIQDAKVIQQFFKQVNCTEKLLNEVDCFIDSISTTDFSYADSMFEKKIIESGKIAHSVIKEKDQVYLIGEPNTRGMVHSVSEVNGTIKYQIFVNDGLKIFFEGQIAKVEQESSLKWVDIDTSRSYLTAYQINNPSARCLYSLNTARIDFVPYQFRPALKLIHADEPRILIADGVGVGKTIEAGLIIKELEARKELENILIICPKPLITEHKWLDEMKRFDEDFTEIDSSTLHQAINETHRDGEWPIRYNKVIVPYSILDSKAFSGDRVGLRHYFGLSDLDPAPHFDLVIIDEAHHIRNGSMEKEKAYAYKCCKYFCDHSDAVVMLTATPLQTSDDDLYTLLNLLRPDVVIDKETFCLMLRPNAYISKSAILARSAEEGWQDRVIDELKKMALTQWGENVIVKNPIYVELLRLLANANLSREERVKVISDIESLHSFNTMLNRTRRKDIQDFCIRRPYTIDVCFTETQQKLYEKILEFEKKTLATLHEERSVPFMMSTITRQAASCVFGLAPHIKDMLNRRFTQIFDGVDTDGLLEEIKPESTKLFIALASEILSIAENLPEEDPKFDSILEVIFKKQNLDDNKIMLFSTFRHTLAYLKKKLTSYGLRVAQIDGSVKDDNRVDARNRFKLSKSDKNALDILLFTEVGSEGLDYQFCNMMINYDLPWNPMRIEQRIGRIDRRGQLSESVSIYNVITQDTVDADIYYRCLKRIGIFERSIGECDEILGTIGANIEKIVIDSKLSDDERNKKLEQTADNEVRRLQEMNRLEDEEKELFAFDLSSYAMAQEIHNAESPWISPRNIQIMTEKYLADVLGEGSYIIGETDKKTLRLSASAREKLRNEFKALPWHRNVFNKSWESFLKDKKSTHSITFNPEVVDKDNSAFAITSMHPLARQAAKHFKPDQEVYIGINYSSDYLTKGIFPFAVYAWNYIGFNEHSRLVMVCNNDEIAAELPEILQTVQTSQILSVESNTWDILDEKQIQLWQKERIEHINNVNATASYRIESITNNHKNQKRVLERLIYEATEERIERMRRSELENAIEMYESKINSIKEIASRADIHVSLIANGIIEVL